MIPRTILLINCESSVREVMQTCLIHLAGWQVLGLDSPLEGLVWARQEKPDAIILDLYASNMDYSTFLQMLRAQPETQLIPVVILTAGAKWFNLESLQRFQVAGVLDYLPYPQKLPEKIVQLLEWDSNQNF